MKSLSRLSFLLIAALMLALPVTAQDNVTISFVHIFGGENDTRGALVQEIAAAFMAENPGVTIEVSSLSADYTELFNSALLAAEQGNAPTIVQVEEGLTQLAADSGYFTPIAQIASEEQIASFDDMLATVRAYYTLGDELYSVPWNASNPVLYYNKGMFEAAGLDPNDAPATFAEVTAACEAIMAMAAELEITGCINFPLAAWFPEQWVAMQNGLLADNDNGRSARATEVLYTDEPMLSVVTWIGELAASGAFVYSGTPNDYNGEATAFLGKGTAMTINSTAGLALISRFAGLQGIDLGVAALPAPSDEATNGVTIGGASLWVSAGATPAETQAAVDFIFFLTNTENDMKWHQGSGYFPTRESSIAALTEAGWFTENPNFAIAIEQLQASAGNVANAGAVYGPSTEVRQFLVEAIQSVVDGGADPLEALTVAKDRADAALASYNEVVGG
ncbi:MAG: ABC transporter substrate-binding protein [Chloroflexota bacterium]|nr:ABC transporter substrate-binding protein [Chloroflexota bacterium]